MKKLIEKNEDKIQGSIQWREENGGEEELKGKW